METDFTALTVTRLYLTGWLILRILSGGNHADENISVTEEGRIEIKWQTS